MDESFLTFREEITLASRLPQTILIEGLVAALTQRLGADAARAKSPAVRMSSAIIWQSSKSMKETNAKD